MGENSFFEARTRRSRKLLEHERNMVECRSAKFTQKKDSPMPLIKNFEIFYWGCHRAAVIHAAGGIDKDNLNKKGLMRLF